MGRQKTFFYTVSQLTSIIRGVLESGLDSKLTVAGEISGFKKHTSGHCYFSLKDSKSLINCVMWSSKFSSLKFMPEDGMEVSVRGHVDIYPPQGKYQLYVDSISPAGKGTVQIEFEKLVTKLRAEGLFEDKYKKALPRYPMRIAVITSESGAALHDITDSIWGRWPCARIYFASSDVQGPMAGKKLVSAIEKVNQFGEKNKVEVLVIGRGGGSLEDLQAFNEESVARAIFNSRIPVISAVGHEIDTTIADMVADARASTPTKAGAIAVPDIGEVRDGIEHLGKRLSSVKNAIYNNSIRRFESSSGRYVFRNPRMLIKDRIQILDEIQWSMKKSLTKTFASSDRSVQLFYNKLSRYEPHRVISVNDKKLEQAGVRMKSCISEKLNVLDSRSERLLNSMEKVLACKAARSKTCLESLAGKFEGLDPRKTLQRGYSITRVKNSGKILRNDVEVEEGQLLETELADRKYIESKVIKK